MLPDACGPARLIRSMPDPVFTFEPYVAPSLLRNGHCMTVVAWARPRRFPKLPEPVERVFDVAPRTRVLAKCHWQQQAVEPREWPQQVARFVRYWGGVGVVENRSTEI